MREQQLQFGYFHCKVCNRNITIFVVTSEPEKLERWRDEIVEDAENHHWYALHYNCAVCGKWIPSGERKLIREDSFKEEVHRNYALDKIPRGLFRVHSGCIKK